MHSDQWRREEDKLPGLMGPTPLKYHTRDSGETEAEGGRVRQARQKNVYWKMEDNLEGTEGRDEEKEINNEEGFNIPMVL